MGLLDGFQKHGAFFNRKKTIEKQVRKDKDILGGGQSLKVQLGFLGRQSFDFDVISPKPLSHAKKLTRTLNTQARAKVFYSEPSKFHKGTYKVKHIGPDERKGTADDIGIADFSKPTRKNIKTVNIDGIRYSALSEISKDKRSAISQKEFMFRHEKDRDDLNRIRAHRKQRRY